MARRQYHENSLTDHYEIAAVTIGNNNDFDSLVQMMGHRFKP